MDNNNIVGMNPQQFSQNTPQTSQPHMGMSGKCHIKNEEIVT